MPVDFSVNNDKIMLGMHVFAQKEISLSDVKESHDEEHGHNDKTKTHVHTSLFAEITQWIGIGILVGLPVIVLKIQKDKAGLIVVTLLSVGIGIMHVLLAPDHLEAGIEHAGFFLIIGLSQIGFGTLFMLKPSRIISVVGIVGNVGSIILYFVTRTENLPPPFGAPEGIDAIGITAKIIEILLVISLVFLIQKRLVDADEPL